MDDLAALLSAGQLVSPAVSPNYGRIALRRETARYDGHHGTLISIAGQIGSLVAAGLLREPYARAAFGRMAANKMATARGAAEVSRAWESGLSYGQSHPRRVGPKRAPVGTAAVAREQMEAWRRAVEADPPTGRAAGTRRKLLAGVYRLAQDGHVDLRMSYREWALAAGVSVSTVHRHVESLAPWIRQTQRGATWRRDADGLQVPPPREDSRSRWSLQQPRTLAEQSDLRMPGRSRDCSARVHSSHPLDDPSHDVWGGRGGSYAVWSVLATDGTTVAEVAGVLGIQRQPVERHLRRLTELGLARRDGGRPARWCRLYRDDLPDGEQRTARAGRHRAERERLDESRSRYVARRDAEALSTASEAAPGSPGGPPLTGRRAPRRHPPTRRPAARSREPGEENC